MTLFEAFKRFQSQYREDPQTTKKIRKYIETSNVCSLDVDEGIGTVEEYIKSIRNRKIKPIAVYLDFIKWLRKNVNRNIQSNISKDYVTSTRRIELIKYLQEPHSRKEITDQFVINDRTLDNDFKALERGIEVLGCLIKVTFKKYDREGRITVDEKKYHSSCNPLFLPLNMTELFLLTNIIPKYLINNDELSGSYQSILKKIYPQLTDYSLNLMKLNKNDVPDINRPFEFEYNALLNNNFNQLVYFYKRSEETTFVINCDGTPIEIIGVIDDIKDDVFVLKTPEGKVTYKLECLVGTKDFDKTYK